MIVQRNVTDENSPIDVIWYVERKDINEEEKIDVIVPTGHIHLVYNIADPFYVILNDEKVKLPDYLLVGQFKEAMNVEYVNQIKQLGIAIKPLAFYSVFHDVDKFYKDIVIDCKDMKVLGSLHDFVVTNLNCPDIDIEQVFDNIIDYFYAYGYQSDDMKTVSKMVDYLESNEGIVNIRDMAKYFSFSVSALERKFKKYLGVTPKAYGDIIRFKYAIKDEEPERLFYDQSHFIKVCKKYTSKVPSDISESVEISLQYMLGLK